MPGLPIRSTLGLPLDLTEVERFAAAEPARQDDRDEPLPAVAAHPDAQGDIGKARAHSIGAGPALSPKRGVMKAIKFVGLGVGLAALFGCAAEAPSTAPPMEIVSVGAPTPLAPGPTASTGTEPRPLAAAYRSGPPPAPLPATIDNSYHPSWTVDVIN
jgi:hypothetical protein